MSTNYGPQGPQQPFQPQGPWHPQQGFQPQTPYPQQTTPQQGFPDQPQNQWQQPPWSQQPQQPYGQPQWNQQQTFYQQPQPMMPSPASKKKPIASKKVLIVLGVVLVLCISAGAIISSVVNYVVNTQPHPIGKLGDTITVNNVSCTFMSVQELAPDVLTQPQEGNEFIVVHVKIQNSNTQVIGYNPFDFHVRSGAGNVTTANIVPPGNYNANNILNPGQLDQNGTVEGDIIFQVPMSDHKAELTWQPNIFGNSTQNAWVLGL